MSSAKMQAARELIQEKNYSAARAVLETMPNDSTAREWLARVNKLSPPVEFPVEAKRGQHPKWIDYVIGMALAAVGLFVCASLLLPRSAAAPIPTSTAVSTPGPSPTITDTPTPTLTFTPSPTWTPVPPTATSAPLVFSGNADKVIGPVTIPAGTYRARVTTAGYVIVEVNPSSGTCGKGSGPFLSSGLFFVIDGQAANGAEAVFTSEGCTALIAVSNVSSPPWALEFEKVG